MKFSPGNVFGIMWGKWSYGRKKKQLREKKNVLNSFLEALLNY